MRAKCRETYSGSMLFWTMIVSQNCNGLFSLEGFRSKLDYYFFRDVIKGNLQLIERWTIHPLNIPLSPKIAICVILQLCDAHKSVGDPTARGQCLHMWSICTGGTKWFPLEPSRECLVWNHHRGEMGQGEERKGVTTGMLISLPLPAEQWFLSARAFERGESA